MANTYTSIHIKLEDIESLKIDFLNDKKTIHISIGNETLFFDNVKELEKFIENIKNSLNIN